MREFQADNVVYGVPWTDVYEESATQKYPIGSIYERRGRRWRYCRAGAAMIAHRGAFNMAIIPGDTGGTTYGQEADLYGDHVAGVTEVLFATATAWAKDRFQGGWIVIFNSGGATNFQTIYILGNDLGNGTSCKLYLDEPLRGAVADATGVTLYANPYYQVNQSGSARSPVVSVPNCDVTNGYYFWGQTKGPCWVTPTAYGGAILKVWHTDGCIKDAANGSTEALQIAGWMMNRDVSGSYGDGLIYLMIE